MFNFDIEIKQNMAVIQFSHANGFPALSYSYLFDLLKPHEIRCVDKFGHGKYRIIDKWDPMVDELIDDIDIHYTEPVVALGHSLGGILSLFASDRRPELFRMVIVMDSPIFTNYYRLLIRFAQKAKIDSPVAKTAIRRRKQFKSYEDAYDYLKERKLFKPFNEKCFSDYIKYGFEPFEGGVKLAYDTDVEYRIFQYMPTFFKTFKMKMPSYFIHALHGDVAKISNKKWIERNFKGIQLIPFDGSHMFPFEKPVETAELVKKLINLHA